MEVITRDFLGPETKPGLKVPANEDSPPTQARRFHHPHLRLQQASKLAHKHVHTHAHKLAHALLFSVSKPSSPVVRRCYIKGCVLTALARASMHTGVLTSFW